MTSPGPCGVMNALRNDRTTRAQKAASRNGLRYQASGVEAAVRNTALRMMGGAGLLKRYDWLYGWRMTPPESQIAAHGSPSSRSSRQPRRARTRRSRTCRSRTTAPAGVIDPVCGMTVDPHKTPHRAEYAGHLYYFCSAGCRTKFVADPARYLGGVKEPEPVLEGTIYTCPMHPEIRQLGPGACPICGMALEPELVTAETGPNPELVDMTRRFWIGAALSLPVVVLEMGGASRRRSRLDSTGEIELDSIRAGDAGRAVVPAGRSLCAAGSRCSPAISTCSR